MSPQDKSELMKAMREERKKAGLKRVNTDEWVAEQEHPAATEAVNRALKPFKDRARKQLKKWKDEQEKN